MSTASIPMHPAEIKAFCTEFKVKLPPDTTEVILQITTSSPGLDARLPDFGIDAQTHRGRPSQANDYPEYVAPTIKRRSPRKSGLYSVLHAAQQFGFTHPNEGFWLKLPREFDAILALEHKAVAQVVLHVLRQTIGWVGDGPDGRREWARISQRDFARAGLMDDKNADLGIREALAKHYILRRRVGTRSYEYAIRWRGTN